MQRREFVTLIGGAVGLSVFAYIAAGNAAELKVMSPIALKPIFEKVGAELERSTGHKLTVFWGETGGIRSDIEKGVPFDVAVLTLNFVDDLIKQGKLDGNTRTPIARSGIGIAIRKGAPKPDVSTTDAFKHTLLNANSIGFVAQSASSRYLETLFARLGIAEEIKSKLRPLKGPAAPYVAKGDPEIAITQISTIIPFEGVEFAGPLPPDVQLYTVFAAAASPASNSDAARALLKMLVSPSNAPVLEKIGLEPLN
jgi:molybdate transport system substrate-binding protein